MVVGLAMLTYLKKQKTIIFEYLALQPSFRLNAVFFTYISCIYNRLLLNILYVINQKYGLNL